MWFKVDDELHEHRKARKAGKAAIGVWVLAGSWSSSNGTDGFVPEDVLRRWGTPADARRLVDAGLWLPETFHDEDGWRFHDWKHFQPSAAVTAAKKAAEREAGLRGNHRRWHVERSLTDPDCDYCVMPGQEPDSVLHDVSGTRSGTPSPTRSGQVSGDVSGLDRPYPVPEPLSEMTTSSHVSAVAPLPVRRDDVERICVHLADRIEANGSKRPSVTKGWRDAARLMLDRDNRPEDDVHGAIDWCQSNDFWRGNILSLPKLREKYDQLRLQAERQQRPNTKQAAEADMWARAEARAIARDQQAGQANELH